MRERLILVFTRHLQTVFVLLLLAGFLYVALRSADFRLGARLFPQIVAWVGIGVIALELLNQAIRRGRRQERDFSDLSDEEEASPAFYARGLLFFGWLIVFYGLIYLVGPVAASGLFVLLLLLVQFRAYPLVTAGVGLGVMGLIWGLSKVLNLRWPAGVFNLLG